jgi:hypothetical protein
MGKSTILFSLLENINIKAGECNAKSLTYHYAKYHGLLPANNVRGASIVRELFA